MKTNLILALLIVFNLSCSKAVIRDVISTDEDILRVWVLADIQPRNSKHRKAFTRAVNDINASVPEVQFAVVAGDIVNSPSPEVFDWYIKEKSSSYINKWHEIIGNHDLKTDDGVLFRKKLQVQPHYSRSYGNMLFIFLSDEVRGKPTEINDDTFEWWKNLVINNQDKILVVITHAPLEGSKIPFSSFRDRQILRSERFRNILKKYRVDLWLSGHLHLPHGLTNTLNTVSKLNNATFIHVSSIRPEIFGLKHSQSRILDFFCDEDKVRVMSRDHSRKRWNHGLMQEITLSKKVVCEN